MNNIFNHYAVPITNAAGQATGTKVLQKDGCQKACAEILLVTKQVSEAKMEAYMAEFFPRTWAKFDLNNTGEIDITESHTFMRALLGRLNQFVLAPGSLTDIKVWVDKSQGWLKYKMFSPKLKQKVLERLGMPGLEEANMVFW